MEKMHYYQHNIGDYRRDTSHLSLLEHGVYRQLLDLYHLSEKPIPEETDWVIRRLAAKTDLEISAIQLVLSDFFVLNVDGALGYSHKRCDKDIDDYLNKAETAKTNGKLGGRPKKTQPVILANPDETISQANHKPITINQEPKKIATVVACPSEMDESIWEDWMAIRKKKKAPLTETAWKMFINEVESAGWTIDKAIKECCLRNWQSFKAEWVEKKATTFSQVKADVAKSTVIDSADYEATKRREAEEDAIPKNGPSLETLAKMAAIRAKARA